MKTLFKAAIVASLMLGGAVQPVLAQDSGPVVQGLAIANLEAVVANTNAYKTAQQQRQTTYKAQYDAAESRRQQISAQMKPLVDKFNKDRQAANANQASLQQQAQTIQQIQESGKEELQKLLEPVAMSEAYVQEQINDKLPDAVKNAMAKRKISLLISPENVISANASYNLNQDILSELNTLIPSAQLVPPKGWEPREVREQRAAQQQAQQGATGSQPQGR